MLPQEAGELNPQTLSANSQPESNLTNSQPESNLTKRMLASIQKWLNLVPSSQANQTELILASQKSLNFLSSSQANLTEVILASDVGVNYQNLENLLKAGQWKAANQETTRVMLKVAKREQQGWLNYESIKNFPCTDLRTIDQLWVKYSNGHFGFSVQKRIWLECGGKVDYWSIECLLSDRLGWCDENLQRIGEEKINYSLDSTQGHLPYVANAFFVSGETRWYFLSRVQTCKL